ncbi:polyprenyl synthetase family protein [Catalinimonas niigatensis]|uniref:polyprenyl synthetase family protein n=1 Tax=Catalinimonas niigatensis TaxID=1397264 RepID=UPI002666A67F|nr:polyprenyl synthetase family protein [Catalinimonas niigatensis]WPP52712.1 polyprenyl synthetase family protein [Catalinimonas niigatensis]
MIPRVQAIVEQINRKLERHKFGEQPAELYEPIRYIMNLGGKRLRPLLALLAYQLYCDDESLDTVLEPALAVEVFHNFTLMHDDIMDQAPLRRGKPTVHKKWNENIAILSGDVMMVKAYDLLLGIDPKILPDVLRAFNRCAAEVCEGQQWDMNYENRSRVAEEEYLHMIRQKTAVLLGFSLQLGGMLANASAEDCQLLYDFGVNIGISFQLKDDLLDVYADQAKFGKRVGGDIIVNKKTFLLIKALEKANTEQRNELETWLNKEEFDKEAKVSAVKALYNALEIKQLTEQKMNEFFEQGLQKLEQINGNPDKKEILRQFAEQLMEREK